MISLCLKDHITELLISYRHVAMFAHDMMKDGCLNLNSKQVHENRRFGPRAFISQKCRPRAFISQKCRPRAFISQKCVPADEGSQAEMSILIDLFGYVNCSNLSPVSCHKTSSKGGANLHFIAASGIHASTNVAHVNPALMDTEIQTIEIHRGIIFNLSPWDCPIYQC